MWQLLTNPEQLAIKIAADAAAYRDAEGKPDYSRYLVEVVLRPLAQKLIIEQDASSLLQRRIAKLAKANAELLAQLDAIKE